MATPSPSQTSGLSIAELGYGDLEQELATTRRMLERYPSGHDDWQPHEKSMTLSRLASHVAELPKYGTMLVTTDEADFSKNPYVAPACKSAAELLDLFDSKVTELRSVMATADAATLARPWTLRMGEKVFFTRPKAPLIRQMLISHMIHHRAQLGVYYRMLGVPLPGTYGPSADEPM